MVSVDRHIYQVRFFAVYAHHEMEEIIREREAMENNLMLVVENLAFVRTLWLTSSL